MSLPDRQTLTARSPEDLLAMAPILLGFWPHESIVLLTVDGPRPFHARLDLPPLEVLDELVLRRLDDALLGPARRHAARRLVLLYVGADVAAAACVHAALARGAHRSGIAVVAAIAADGRRYRVLADDGEPGAPVDYDVGHHPFVVEALVSGRLQHRSREEMVASLDPEPEAVERVTEAIGQRPGLPTGVAYGAEGLRAGLLQEGRWVRELVAHHVGAGTSPPDADVARLLLGLVALPVRDAAWSLITRADAREHVAFWADVLRRTPSPAVPAPAALLVWACWQAGDGAQAWAAIERCTEVDPEYVLANSLVAVLEQAVPPEAWSGGFDWAEGLT